MDTIKNFLKATLWASGALVLFGFPAVVAAAYDPGGACVIGGLPCDPLTDATNLPIREYECREDGDGTNPTHRCLVTPGQACPVIVISTAPVVDGNQGSPCDTESTITAASAGSKDPNVSVCTDVGSGTLQCQIRANDEGDACKGAEQCEVLDFDLECVTAAVGKRCVANPAKRKIGTWCDIADHCNTGEGFLKLTCEKDRSYCVGASQAVECADDDVNTNANLGQTTVELFNRCDRASLVCNENNLLCQADLGITKATEIGGIGGTTEDIRDQIRKLINIALGFLGVAGVIVTIYGGAMWMSAAGDDEKVEKAKKTIVSGLIGIVIIGIAWTIVSYVLSATQKIGG